MSGTTHKHPMITGQWMETDESRNRLEIAPTESRGVIAVRDTFTPDDILFCTEKQLLKLAEVVSSGRVKNLTRQAQPYS